MYYDLFMNQGYNQEISRGMHNFPSPPAPTPTLKQLFHALYIKLAAACRCLLYFFYKYVTISACNKGSRRHLHAGELATECLFLPFL